LTHAGWKNMSNLDIKHHRIAILTPDGSLQYTLADEMFVLNYQGEMYEVQTPSINLAVTPHHKLYVSVDGEPFDLTRAKDIEDSSIVRYKKAAVNNNSSYIFPCNGKDQYWCYFTALYIIYGHVNHETKRICLNTRDVRTTTILDKLNQKWTFTEKRGYVIDDIQTMNMFASSDMKDKNPHKIGKTNQFPNYVWSLSRSQAIFLLECIMAKCCLTTKIANQYELWTTNLQFRDNLQRLCLHAEKACDFTQTTLATNCWLLTIRSDETETEPIVSYDAMRQTTYEGKIWCLEVCTHIFYVRRDGKTCWTGNSSRHGQKGTCGMKFREEDLPFTKQGITPDIIMNPHAIPSRMTIGHLIECLASKEAVLSGNMSTSIPFSLNNRDYHRDEDGNSTVESIAESLRLLNYDPYGEEILYNPLTGRKMQAKIFIGPTFYQKLRHMVSDKCHARSHGKNEILTRQPVEGRARNGGLRFGEMERDAVLAHGAMDFLRDRLYHNSDPFKVPVCGTCRLYAIDRLNEDGSSTLLCQRCKNSQVKMIETPWCFKLLYSELYSMNIVMKHHV